MNIYIINTKIVFSCFHDFMNWKMHTFLWLSFLYNFGENHVEENQTLLVTAETKGKIKEKTLGLCCST